MNGKVWKLVALFVVLSFLFVSPSGRVAASATPGGTSPDDVTAPTGAWMTVNPGQKIWFAFDFDRHAEPAANVEITMFADPKNGAEFTVMTAAQVADWRKSGKLTGVGAGTENQYVKGSQRFWAGRFGESGTFYVVVEHGKLSTTPTHFRLVIAGPGLTFPAAAKPHTFSFLCKGCGWRILTDQDARHFLSETECMDHVARGGTLWVPTIDPVTRQQTGPQQRPLIGAGGGGGGDDDWYVCCSCDDDFDCCDLECLLDQTVP